MSNTWQFLGMPLMPIMSTLGSLLTARTAGGAGSASPIKMPHTVLVFYAFDLEARQVEGDRLDVIAFLVTKHITSVYTSPITLTCT